MSNKPDDKNQIDYSRLIRLYYEQPLSVDMLPYTPEMDHIVKTYNSYTEHPIDLLTCYRALIRLRKNKKLIARQGKGTTTVQKLKKKTMVQKDWVQSDIDFL